jgi:hypothetical protein
MPHKKKSDTVNTSTVVKVDTAIAIKPVKKEVSAPSLFQNHLLVPQSKYPKLHITHYDYIISSILLLLVVFFVWLYAFDFKALTQVIKDFFSFRNSGKNNRENAATKNRTTIFLAAFFIVTLSLLVGKILEVYNIKLFSAVVPIPNEIIIAIVIVIAYAIKFITIKLSGLLFKIQNEADDYVNTIILYCNVTGLFMLPIIILMFFFKQVSPIVFVYVGIALVATFIVFRTLSGIVLGVNSTRIAKFYLFIYLCGLEILPFIIIIKLIMIGIK